MRARLFRPPVTDDYVRRESLEHALEEGRKYPIVLVSAPAGYGKSTQLSHWIGEADTPYVWISLEDIHNDLGTFLQYLEAGIGDWSPETAKLLRTFSEAAELPPADRIADAVTSAMTDIVGELILVLDDYHSIRNEEIHRFVESLLMHMPDSLRVAIGTRRTPPIALGRLRSRNLVLDIRLQDLQFGDGAMLTIVRNSLGVDLDPMSLAKLKQVTEGWPAGLQMLLMALADNDDVPAFLEKFEGNVWQIQEYLVEEVLRQLPPNVAKRIGTTAILGRFSADLCEAMFDASDVTDVSGQQLVDLIRSRGLFCIPLDERGEWFRYHHLFHDLLLRQVQSELNELEIRALHTRAANWLDQEGRMEEAIPHCLKSDDPSSAAAMILRHKDDMIRNQQWRHIDQALNRLPSEMIENNVELLVLQSWTCGRMGRLTQELDTAQRAQILFESKVKSESIDDQVVGQISALQSTVDYHLADGQSSANRAEKALELLSPDSSFERGEATMMRGVARQMLGDANSGRTYLLEALEQSGSEIEVFKARILMGLCYLNWPDAQLNELQHYATTLLELGREHSDGQAIVHASWFSAAAYYHQDNLVAATDILSPVIAQQWWPHQRSYLNCVQIMCAIHAARGEHAEALVLSENVVRQCLETRATYHLPELHAVQAQLASARGDEVTATNWARGHGTDPLVAAWGWNVVPLSAANLLLRSDARDAHVQAKTILDKHQEFFEKINSIRFLIETLALQAMMHAKSGDEDQACQLLGRAVDLAETGGFIRLFVDLGPDIAPLLNRLELHEQQLKYVGKILAGFQQDTGDRPDDYSSDKAQQNAAGLLEPLSKRENEVLELLAQRLTNKEIGERLFISPDTVKRHAHNIFTKLNVRSRREARAKAIGLGIVST